MQCLEAKDLNEATSLMGAIGKNARVVAGGTDLVPDMKFKRLQQPEYILNLNRIRELNYVRKDTRYVRIGALTLIRTLENPTLLGVRLSVISEAAHRLGTAQVRNQATIGGNLCRASPCAETAPPLLALDAGVVATSVRGERKIPLEEFFKGPGQTALKRNEILKEVYIPNPPPKTGVKYMRLSVRYALDSAIVNVASRLTMDSKGTKTKEVRIALGSVAPTPMRAKKAEQVLVGKPLNAELIEESAQVASEECKPITDVRGTADYRKKMVKVLTMRTLIAAREIAEDNEAMAK